MSRAAFNISDFLQRPDLTGVAQTTMGGQQPSVDELSSLLRNLRTDFPADPSGRLVEDPMDKIMNLIHSLEPRSAPRMYGQTETSVTKSSDNVKLPSDPNQTAFPRVQMDAATASPASKKTPKARKNENNKKSPAEDMASWITSISK